MPLIDLTLSEGSINGVHFEQLREIAAQEREQAPA
jgi:hypothetical protein